MRDDASFQSALAAFRPSLCRTAEPLSQHATFRIGGAARYALFPDSAETLCAMLRLCRRCELPYEIIGNGSNVLFGDRGYDGAIVFTEGLCALTHDGTDWTAEAGVPLTRLANEAQRAAHGDLTFLYGIPGTVGGAVFMNAGAYGGTVSQALSAVRCYDADCDRVVTLPVGACEYGYRTSVFMRRRALVILSATFALREDDAARLRAVMEDFMARRREKQPLEYPSAGSVFKRCAGHFTGQLIEEAGLKGAAVGGAEVSEKHAGFIINRGGATAADVTALIANIRDTIAARDGVSIECEIRMIGEGF